MVHLDLLVPSYYSFCHRLFLLVLVVRIIDEYAAAVVDYIAIVAVAESVELIVVVLMQVFGVVVAAAVGWDFGMQLQY